MHNASRTHLKKSVSLGSDGEGEKIIYADGEKEDDEDDEEIPFGPTGLQETEHSDDDEVINCSRARTQIRQRYFWHSRMLPLATQQAPLAFT